MKKFGLLVMCGLVGALCVISGCTRHAASQKSLDPQASFGASFFREILNREGPSGIVNRLYVAPPDLMTPLFDGISTGSPEWLEVYDGFRQGVDSADRSGTTKDRLDDALTRALEKVPEGVLRFLHEHPGISPEAICQRSAALNEDPSEVLDARELLAIVRRNHSVSKVSDPRVQAERLVCLKTMAVLIRRQSRIYLASHGAADSESKSLQDLSKLEQLELLPVLESARKDVSMSARNDGTFPDGPFRVAKVPRDVLKHCVDNDGRIANPEGPWEATDVRGDQNMPEARLLNACQVAPDEWDLTCQKGGFSPHLQHFRVLLMQGKWASVEEKELRDAATVDSWVECRSLSKLASPKIVNRP